MKINIKILILLQIAIIQFCLIQNLKSQCIIKPGIGVNNIDFKTANLDSIQNSFGKKKLQKFVYKPGYGGTRYELDYPETRTTFYLKKRKKNNYDILYISSKNPTCETVSGVKIGDTKNKLFATMTEPINSWSGNNETHYAYTGIRFVLRPNPSNELIIEEIEIVNESCD